MAVYTPGQTAEALGVPERTLRNWSARFGLWLSESARSQAGQRGRTHRRYESQDMETLRTVKQLAEQHLPLGEIAEVLAGRKAAPSARATRSRAAAASAVAPAEDSPLLVTYHLTKPLTTLFQEQQRLVAQLEDRLARTERELAGRLAVLEGRLAALERGEREVTRPAIGRPAEVTTGGSGTVQGILGAVRARFGGDRPASSLTRNLVRELARRRWGRGDLAVATGLPVDTIDRLLAGEPLPPDVLRSVARALDLAVDDLQADR